MSRSIWKGPFSKVPTRHIEHSSQNDRRKGNQSALSSQGKQFHPFGMNVEEKLQNVWSRSSTILPEHINKKYMVYNGKHWVSVPLRGGVALDMVGHKFGEFSLTKKRKTVHKQNKTKQVTTRKTM